MVRFARGLRSRCGVGGFASPYAPPAAFTGKGAGGNRRRCPSHIPGAAAISARKGWSRSESASVLLLTEAPSHLSAHGESHRDIGDKCAGIPEIGDEVAVARALRHLADQLLETAAKDIEAVTGKEAHLLPS